MKKVGIIMGSDSDLPVVQKAADTLRSLGVPFEAHVYSAHRTPQEARDFAAGAREKGFGVLIAAAGMRVWQSIRPFTYANKKNAKLKTSLGLDGTTVALAPLVTDDGLGLVLSAKIRY